jgi:hypothetical protein
MSSYQVVCVQQRKRRHCVRAVGTIRRKRSNPKTNPNTHATKRRKVKKILRMMAEGHEFFVYGGKTTTTVKAFDCKCGCHKESVRALRTLANRTTKDDLHDLRLCNFR